MALLQNCTYLDYDFPTGALSDTFIYQKHSSAMLCQKAQVAGWLVPQPGFTAEFYCSGTPLKTGFFKVSGLEQHI